MEQGICLLGMGSFQAEVLDLNYAWECPSLSPGGKQHTASSCSALGLLPDPPLCHGSGLQSHTLGSANKEYQKLFHIKSINQLIARPKDQHSLLKTASLFSKDRDAIFARTSPYHTESPKENKNQQSLY